MTISNTTKNEVFKGSSKIKYSQRYSTESLAKKDAQTDSAGTWFLSAVGKMVSLAKVLIVGVFVDTVRQLYNGVLDEGFVHRLEELSRRDESVKVTAQYEYAKLPFGEFHVQKMGKSCGYRFKLQNNEIGLVILVGSYYRKPEIEGPHLKIECSPTFILNHTPEMLQVRLDTIARGILHGFSHQGVCVHLATDVQGWRPGYDFLKSFVTYARMVRSYLGLQTAEIGQGFSDVVAKYGEKESETITIGKPTGLQTSIYNKTKQIRVIDKVDHYHDLWACHSLGQYDKDGPDVYRVEYRFHHSVVKELEINGQTGFVSFEQIAEHLNQLWRYALLRNRLEVEPNHIDPVWQLLLEDAVFDGQPPYGGIKRKKKVDLSAIGKNIQIMLGNLISIQARKSDDLETFVKLLRAAGIYQDIVDYYRVERKIDEIEFRERLQKSLIDRRRLRNAA